MLVDDDETAAYWTSNGDSYWIEKDQFKIRFENTSSAVSDPDDFAFLVRCVKDE